jgi:hypothetical protein
MRLVHLVTGFTDFSNIDARKIIFNASEIFFIDVIQVTKV